MKKILVSIAGVLSIVLLLTSCTSKKINENFYKDISFDSINDFKHRVTGLAFNEESLLFAIGYESGKVELFDAEKSKLKFVFNSFTNRASILKFSENGKYLSVGGWFEWTTKIYDTQTGELFIELQQTKGPELFVFDDSYLFIANTSTLKIFNLKTKTFHENTYKCAGVIESISLSHNKNYLSIGSTGNIQLFSIDKQKELINLELLSTKKEYSPKSWVTHSWFSLDDTELITLNRHGKMDIWSVPDLEKKETKTIKTNFIEGAIFSKDRKSSIIIGTEGKGGFQRPYYVEKLDLKTNKNNIYAQLGTNLSNISSWAEMNNQEFVFIEDNKHKSLFRLSNAKKYNDIVVFKQEFDWYLSAPNFYKSFSLAYDDDTSYAVGVHYRAETQNEADRIALENCDRSRNEFNVTTECVIYARGDDRL